MDLEFLESARVDNGVWTFDPEVDIPDCSSLQSPQAPSGEDPSTETRSLSYERKFDTPKSSDCNTNASGNVITEPQTPTTSKACVLEQDTKDFLTNLVKAEMLEDLPRETRLKLWSQARPQILIHGNLYKKGHIRKNWKKRNFMLSSSGDLTYYAKTTRKGKISLLNKIVRIEVGSTLRTCIHRKRGNSESTSWRFSIEAKETLDSTRSERIMVACASKKEMLTWVSHLHEFCTQNAKTKLILHTEVEIKHVVVSELALLQRPESSKGKNCKIGRRKSDPNIKASFECSSPRRQTLPSHHRQFHVVDENWNENVPSKDGILRIIKFHTSSSTFKLRRVKLILPLHV
jgi:hypothetical protein